MLKSCIVTAVILGQLALAGASVVSNNSSSVPSLLPGGLDYSPRNGSRGILPCEALKDAGLENRLLFPTDAAYEPQIATWWALNARRRPYCLFLPQNSQEVSSGLTAMVNANNGAGDWHIAVRSGGHSSTEVNNIVQGVTIDLSMLNSTSYDPEANIAKIEPGGRWKDVYADLATYGVTVAGGRDGGVGVGGYLLGGGISYFAGRVGFSCDAVVNFEVVLGNGTIINANRTANADLWQALKGGSSNFGIVTRFDTEAFSAQNLYYNLRLMNSNYSDAVNAAVVGFANQSQTLANDSLVVYYSHNTSIASEIVAATIHVNTQGIGNTTTAMDVLSDTPTLYNITILESMAESALNSQLPAGTRNAGSTLTFRNDPEILSRCVEFHADYVKTLKRFIDPDKFTTFLFFQPLPSYMGAIGQQQGGNMLGLDDLQSNAVMWTSGVAVDSDDAALAIAQAELNAMTARVKELSRSLNGDIDFIYLNYADTSQDPLGNYGLSNIQHMRDVAARYDPAGVFQTRVPGGFKISRVV